MAEHGPGIGGDWTGVYDYGEGFDEAVPFSAMLFDIAGAVWGTTEEPNSFAPGDGKILLADVSGTRSGREVRFRKTYRNSPPGGEYPVDYAGLVTNDGTRIEGRWQISAPGGILSGPFVMNRKEAAEAEVEVLARATVDISV